MKTEDIKFNPDDYAYLDNIPLDGWMWEFIRRNPYYIRSYDHIKKLSEKASLSTKTVWCLMDKYELTSSSDNNVLYEELRTLEKEYLIRPLMSLKENSDSKHFLLIGLKKYRNVCVCIPNPISKYSDFIKNKPFIHGATAVRSYKFSEESIGKYDEKLYYKNFSRIFRDRLTNVNLQNTLYLGVSLSANLEDVEKAIGQVLRQHFRKSKRKVRTDKWKYYLITYDLYNTKKITYEKIADKLGEAYPDHQTLIDYVNLKNYYKTASTLIHGEYNKYLRITK